MEQTAAEWAADATIYPAGAGFGYESDTGRSKKFDGLSRFSQLDYTDAFPKHGYQHGPDGSDQIPAFPEDDVVFTGMPFAPPAGTYFTQSPSAAAVETLVGIDTNIVSQPVTFKVDTRIDEIGVVVETEAVDSNVKIVVYDSDADGMKNAVVLETAAIPTIASGAQVEDELDFTFTRDAQYYIDVRFDGDPTIAALPLASARVLGVADEDVPTYFTTIERLLAFATAAPDPWVFDVAELTASVKPPVILMHSYVEPE